MYGKTANEQREANYRKNRGDPGQWFEHRATYREPQPAARVTKSGEGTAEKYRQCESKEMLSNYKLPPADDPAPVRLRDEDGRKNADKFINQDDKWFDYPNNQNYYPDKKPPRLGTEKAKIVKETNEQQRSSDWYGHRSDPNDLEQPPKPRCPTQVSSQHKERMFNNPNEWKEHPQKRRPEEEPQPAAGPPRTKPQGMEYALRSRGTGQEWMEHRTVKDEGPAGEGGPYRCNSAQAAANWQRSRGNAMRDCFDYSADKSEPQKGPKVHGKAEEYLKRNQQGSSALWKQDDSETNAPPAHRTRPEARAIADKNAGSLGQWLDQSHNKDYNSPRPQPRLPTGAAQNAAERNKGCATKVVGQGEYPNAVYKKTIQPRGAGSNKAQETAAQNRGSSAKTVIGASNLAPETPRGGRAVSQAGESNFQKNKGSIGSLFSSYGKLGPEDQPQPRLRPEAVQNAQRFRGSDFFKVIQQAPQGSD